jgi:hypothetical protein
MNKSLVAAALALSGVSGFEGWTTGFRSVHQARTQPGNPDTNPARSCASALSVVYVQQSAVVQQRQLT